MVALAALGNSAPGSKLSGKVRINVSDTTEDYLFAKLKAGTNITLTLENPSGVSDISIASVSTIKVGNALIGAEPAINFIQGIGVALNGFDNVANNRVDVTIGLTAGFFVRTAPTSTSGNTIIPTTDSTGLTVKGQAGGTSDVMDLYDGKNPQNLFWQFVNDGSVFFSVNSPPGILFATANATARAFGVRTSNDTFIRVSIAPQAIQFGDGSTQAEETLLSRPAAGRLRISTSFAPANTLGALGLLGNEASASEVILRENAGNLEINATTRPTVDNSDDLGAFSLNWNRLYFGKSSTVAPTTTDIPNTATKIWKNTTDGTVKLYYNDGGTLKSVTLT